MNIVLASMDGVRPDFLTHAYFHRIKKEGLEFTTCIAQASHTSTSHTSILTGLYPFHHGVRWLVDYDVRGTMVQEILKEHGFSTAAFVGGFPLAQGNLDRGFDVFDYEEAVDDTQEGREKFMPANVVVQKAIQWLGKNKSTNNFVFMHFFDAHLMLRSEFGTAPWPEKDAQGIFIDVDKYLGRRKRRYGEEIDFIGSQLALLRDAVDIDLLIVTSDHGTKMEGERNYPWVYNSKGKRVGTQFHVAELYEEQLRVPLIFWGKKIPRRCIHEQVRSIDIVPTVLDFLHINIPKVDGSSLLKGKYPEYAYSETYFAQLVEANRRAYELYNKFHWGWHDIDSLVSIRSNTHKLISTVNSGAVENYRFYNLVSDPKEEHNVLEDGTEANIRHALERYLWTLIKDDTQRNISSHIVEEDVKRRLESLGYL